MYIIVRIIKSLNWFVIIFKVVLIAIIMLILLTILYISNAKIFWVIRLLLVKF